MVRDGRAVLSNVLASSAHLHSVYGGIVPEIASRRQIAVVLPVLREALSGAGIGLDRVDGIAVTKGPGLIGSLLVGLNMAKALSYSRNIPYVGVSHLDGHLWAVTLEKARMPVPFLGLLVSGGHTALYVVRGPGETTLVGSTRDDAAGEAFDKVAIALGLGYPGGPVIDSLARTGDPAAFRFPRAKIRGHGLDFSFSGIKTHLAQFIAERRGTSGRIFSRQEMADVCASFQEAVVDMLFDTTIRASRSLGLTEIVVCGGVAANSRVRARFQEGARGAGLAVTIPSASLCTDNGAMIAALGYHVLRAGHADGLGLDAYAS